MIQQLSTLQSHKAPSQPTLPGLPVMSTMQPRRPNIAETLLACPRPPKQQGLRIHLLVGSAYKMTCPQPATAARHQADLHPGPGAALPPASSLTCPSEAATTAAFLGVFRQCSVQKMYLLLHPCCSPRDSFYHVGRKSQFPRERERHAIEGMRERETEHECMSRARSRRKGKSRLHAEQGV